MARRPAAGAVLFLTFLMMLVLTGLALAVGINAHYAVVASRSQLLDQQAMYIAEAGWQRARQALSAGTWTAAISPGNTYTESFGAGEYRVTIVDNGSSTDTVTSEGYVPNQTTTAAKRKIVETALPINNTSTNQSLTATASASSFQGGNTPDKANDGSTGTRWRAATASGSGEWLAMDYGSSERTLNQIVLLERGTDINALTIEFSCDASSWTTVPGLSVVESPTSTWTATFPTIRERYFRARFTSVAGGGEANVEEFRSFAPKYGFGSVTTQW